MVIYSIYPPEVVLGETETPKRECFTVELDGKTFVLEIVGGKPHIVSLFSLNPRDYLDPNWQPGATFGLGPRPQT